MCTGRMQPCIKRRNFGQAAKTFFTLKAVKNNHNRGGMGGKEFSVKKEADEVDAQERISRVEMTQSGGNHNSMQSSDESQEAGGKKVPFFQEENEAAHLRKGGHPTLQGQ